MDTIRNTVNTNAIKETNKKKFVNEITLSPVKCITFITSDDQVFSVDNIPNCGYHKVTDNILFNKGICSTITFDELLGVRELNNFSFEVESANNDKKVIPLYNNGLYLGKAIIEYLDTDLKKMSDDLFETLVERIDKEYTYGSSDNNVLIGCDLTGYDTTPLFKWLCVVNRTCNNFFNSIGGKRLHDRNIHDIVAFHIRCDGDLDNVIDLVLMDSVTGECVCNICELDVELSEKSREILLNFKETLKETR